MSLVYLLLRQVLQMLAQLACEDGPIRPPRPEPADRAGPPDGALGRGDAGVGRCAPMSWTR